MKRVGFAGAWATRGVVLLALTLAAERAGAQLIPALSTLSVRVLDSVSGKPEGRGRAIRAMVIAPLYAGPRLLVAPRTMLEGTVVDAGVEKDRGSRQFLHLTFTSLVVNGGARVPISARVVSVENSRDTVDSLGRIVGPPKPGLVRDKRDWAAVALGTLNPIAGVVFFAAIQGGEDERHRRIAFDPGTDMIVRMMTDVPLPAWPVFQMPAAVTSEAALGGLLARLPLRALAAGGRVAGDFVNVVFIAGDEQLRGAFQSAGWVTPDRSSLKADFETFIKAAKGEGYAHQPVSKQLVFGRESDLVYQRITDTFAKRHHLRLWRTDVSWQGVPVWVAAATHDIGIEFSTGYRSFTHRTDRSIDGERGKVVSDFVAALQVEQLSLVQRVPPPLQATRVQVDSDWRVAVMRVKGSEPDP